MTSTTLIANHTVVINDPTAGIVNTGRYDDQGNAILRKANITIKPGSFFEFPEGEELESLLQMEAVRRPDETELLLYERAMGAQSENV
jgi:hypothetical protein